MRNNCIVLAKIKSGFENKVKEEFLRIEEVKNAYITYGNYDVVIEIDGQKTSDLRKLVTEKIRGIEEVISSKTMFVSPS